MLTLKYCKYLFPLKCCVLPDPTALRPPGQWRRPVLCILLSSGCTPRCTEWWARSPAPCCRCLRWCQHPRTPWSLQPHTSQRSPRTALRVFVPHGRCSWSRCAWCTAQRARRSPPPAAAGNAGWTPPHPFSSHCETTSMPPRGCPSGAPAERSVRGKADLLRSPRV